MVQKLDFFVIFAELYDILDNIVWLTTYDNPIHCITLSMCKFCAF